MREGVPTPSGRGPVWRTSTLGHILTTLAYTGHAASFRQHNPRGKNRHQRGFRRPEDQVVMPEGTVPALVDAATFAAVQERMALNKRLSGRRNGDPTETLLRAGFARCGYCGRGMVVNRNPRWKTRYVCTSRNPGDQCAEIPSIGAEKLDHLAWADVVRLILEPDKIRDGIEQMLASEDVGADAATLDRSIAELERKQRALVSNLALLDADSASMVREQLAGLSAQRRTLEAERAELVHREVERQTQRDRLTELTAACQLVASNLNNLTYEQKRLAVQAFDVQVKVYKDNHEPRYEVVPGPSFVNWIVSSTELNQPISAFIDSRTAPGTGGN